MVSIYPEEIEMALIISSKDSQAIVSQLASLRSIATYRLVPQATQVIHDSYLDTLDRALQIQKVALRIRRTGVTHWITLKGPSQSTGWGGMKRLEIELPWSERALARVLEELADRGTALPQRCEDFDQVYPLKVMMGLGLQVVQDRNTCRQVRNIVPADTNDDPVLAEMALDSVVYGFNGCEIGHREVEIEAKAKNGTVAAAAVSKALLAAYESVLRPWPHGKLATGQAIEQLLRAGVLGDMLNVDHSLGPVAYQRLEEYLLEQQAT